MSLRNPTIKNAIWSGIAWVISVAGVAYPEASGLQDTLLFPIMQFVAYFGWAYVAAELFLVWRKRQ